MTGLQDLRNPFSTAFLVALLFAVIAFIASLIIIFLDINDVSVPDSYFGKTIQPTRLMAPNSTLLHHQTMVTRNIILLTLSAVVAMLMSSTKASQPFFMEGNKTIYGIVRALVFVFTRFFF